MQKEKRKRKTDESQNNRKSKINVKSVAKSLKMAQDTIVNELLN